MEFTKGMAVISRAGRDAGRLQLVTDCDGAYVYVADGKEHKLAKPKKKNPKHLQRTNLTFDAEQMTDKKLRTLLREHDIAEESDKLV